MTPDAMRYGTALIVLLLVMAPLGAAAELLRAGGRPAAPDRLRVAGRATLVSLIPIVGFAVVGQVILAYLDVAVPAIAGAGGLVLLLVAWDLLHRPDAGEPTGRDGVGGTAWAIPGAVAAVIVWLSAADGRLISYLTVAAAILTAHAVYFATLRFSVTLLRLLGVAGINLLARIAGVLLAAIAVQLVADSVRGFVEGA
ncbi:MarC family protein [Skermania piniformis]|uniref:UPF0056 membrane protein n=1 Tax=Skermania pinensis TaxID=39122 RepID=A0ABX8S5M4_9ACTN|nr:MarC family protein [Skermania piniformis]QXQ13124.1 MarC family protein [Skermania piniformis]